MSIRYTTSLSRTSSFNELNEDNWTLVDSKIDATERKVTALTPPPHEAIVYTESSTSLPPLTKGRTISVENLQELSSKSGMESKSSQFSNLISRIYHESSETRTLPLFNSEENSRDIGFIQLVRNVFESCPILSWGPILSNSAKLKEGLSENPRLFNMLAHYLFQRNPRQNQALIQVMNTPLLESLPPSPNTNSLLYSLGSLPRDANSSFFFMLMQYLSMNQSIALPEAKPYEPLISWIFKNNFSLPIPKIAPNKVSEFYDCNELGIESKELSFLLVFDIFCAQNSEEKLKRLCKAQDKNISDNLKLHCLNKLVQTQRFDLAASIIESKSKSFHKLAKALAELEYSQVIKEAKKVLLDDNADALLVKTTLINFFIDQKQWDYVKELIDVTSNLTFKESAYIHLIALEKTDLIFPIPLQLYSNEGKNRIAQALISAKQYSRASEVLISIVDTNARKAIYEDLQSNGKGELLVHFSKQDDTAKEVFATHLALDEKYTQAHDQIEEIFNLDTKIRIYLGLIRFFCTQIEEYTKAAELLKTIADSNIRRRIFQTLKSEGFKDFLSYCSKEDEIATGILTTDLALEEKYTLASDLIKNITSLDVKMEIFQELIKMQKYDTLFILCIALENDTDKHLIAELFFDAKQYNHGQGVFKRLPDSYKQLIIQKILLKQVKTTIEEEEELTTNSEIIEAFISVRKYDDALKFALKTYLDK